MSVEIQCGNITIDGEETYFINPNLTLIDGYLKTLSEKDIYYVLLDYFIVREKELKKILSLIMEKKRKLEEKK